jgi:hypothetical protein
MTVGSMQGAIGQYLTSKIAILISLTHFHPSKSHDHWEPLP